MEIAEQQRYAAAIHNEFDAILARLRNLDLSADDGFKLLRLWDALDKASHTINDAVAVNADELDQWAAVVGPILHRIMGYCEEIKDGERDLKKPPPNDHLIVLDAVAIRDSLRASLQRGALANLNAEPEGLRGEQLFRVASSRHLSHAAMYGFLGGKVPLLRNTTSEKAPACGLSASRSATPQTSTSTRTSSSSSCAIAAPRQPTHGSGS